MGAETSAYITVDRLGAPRAAGGMCVTARDLARVGQLIVEEGGGVIPPAWIQDLYEAGDPAAWNAGPFVEYFLKRPMHYRSKWYVVRGEQPLLFAFGIHGQHLFVDRAGQIVIAKLSSQAQPLDAPRMAATLGAVDEIRKALRAP
jgi:CubicO group peptidase (beta-lactamase class C family)